MSSITSRGTDGTAPSALMSSLILLASVRPDYSIPFRLPELPRRLNFSVPNGVVVSAPSACDCGPKMGPCTHRSLCGATGDNVCQRYSNSLDSFICGSTHRATSTSHAAQFALVYGLAAQHAYFTGYHEDFVHCRRRAFQSGVCLVGKNISFAGTAESKLGASLAMREIPIRDIRFTTRRFADPSVVRSECGPLESQPEFDMPAAAVATIPPGPWDLEGRRTACEPLATRPAGWEALCAGNCSGISDNRSCVDFMFAEVRPASTLPHRHRIYAQSIRMYRKPLRNRTRTV